MAYDIGLESRISVLRDFLANLPTERFDMTTRSVYLEWPDRTEHRDGAAVCLAGWTERLFGRPHDSDETVAGYLSLTPAQAKMLFYPPDFFTGRRTLADAVHVLDRLLATGEIAWPAAIDPPSRSRRSKRPAAWLIDRLPGGEARRQTAVG